MNNQSENQTVSAARSGEQSFFVYAINPDRRIQQYADPESFDAQMRTGNSNGLVIYEHPARLVAKEIATGSYDSAMLRHWLDKAARYLDVIRQHRRRLLVIEKSATENPRAKAAFSKIFPGHKQPDEFMPPSELAPPLYSLIALFAVRQFSPTAQLLSELEASGIEATDNTPTFEDSLLLIAKELDSLSRSVPVPAFEAIKERLSASHLQLDKIKKENRELERINENLEQRAEKRGAIEHEALRRQVLDLQDSLQTVTAKRDEAENLGRALQREVADLNGAISLIHKSTSWRISAPVRAIKKVFSR